MQYASIVCIYGVRTIYNLHFTVRNLWKITAIFFFDGQKYVKTV